MKKLITIIILCLFLSSCDKQSNIQKEENIPVEVVKMASAHSYDTLIVVKTEEAYYEYKNDAYVSTIQGKNDQNTAIIIGIVIGIVGLLFIFGLFSIISD